MPCLRMSVNRLREGMMIKEDVFSKTGAVIVPDGAVVTKDVVALLTRHFVDSVMVEYPTGRKERPEQQEQSAPAKEQHLKEFQAEFSVAEQSISEELKDIVYRSKDVNISMLLEPLNGLLKKADDDTDLADMLLHMKKQQSGLYAHTINVALFGQLLARWSGCTEAEMEEVMAAGLLHDIGFLELWKDGQEQTEFLQEYETERYEKHVVSGYNLIKKMNIDQRIKQAVLTHHERVNGSGFPLQVMGDNINWISRILAVADTYDALTMRQGDKAGISAFEAIKKMEVEGYNRLDANYLMTFLKRIAETMIQRNVILNDGRMGRVVMINKYKLSCPLVQVGDAFVDLAKQSRYYIQEILEELRYCVL